MHWHALQLLLGMSMGGLTVCARWRPPLAQAAVQPLKAAMMARWSLLPALLFAVICARAAAASARLSAGDMKTDRP